MTQINLLPWREEARRAEKIHFLFIMSIFFALAFIFILFAHLYFKSLINHQLRRNDYLQNALDQESMQLTLLNKKKKEQNNIIAKLNFIISLQEKSNLVITALDELVRMVPDAITFNKIIGEANTLIILGKANSNLQVTQLMENMSKSKIFEQPELTAITGKESSLGEERFFQLKVQIRKGY